MRWSREPVLRRGARVARQRCATIVAMLRDGEYDAMVIDVETRSAGGCTLALAIAGGEHRGDVVSVVAAISEPEAIAMLGAPCTLRVDAGVPRVELDAGT